MPMLRRHLLLGASAAALSACARLPMPPAATRAPLTLDQAFVGDFTGAGVFRVFLTGDERRFRAVLRGRLTGDRLTVVEDFFYDDGDENRLTWVFDRAGPGRWTGRREDTVGPATVTEEPDGTIRLSYLADFASPQGVTRLAFEDVIYLQEDRLINDAIVSRWGLPVGAVRFEMVRR